MARSFDVPSFYRSDGITAIKRYRQRMDPRKKDLSPTILDFGAVRFKIARHFGFCFGVENAIEIAYRALDENPGKRLFLLSEMIHNPQVNADLQARGVRFLRGAESELEYDFSTLKPDDIVIVPAFGTTVELQDRLKSVGIDPYYYDTTCPFVKKVWKRSAELGTQRYTVVVHGKRTHEETRATFSHSKERAPTIVILDLDDADFIVCFMKGKVTLEEFNLRFASSMSEGFDPTEHFKKIGVVNQTTMLAEETKAIAKLLRNAMCEIYGPENINEHFADTRDTLCYATNENQKSTKQLIEAGADLAVVVGGYNSSNTSHLVELCQERLPTFYIKDAGEIIDRNEIKHFNLESRLVIKSHNWLFDKEPTNIALTSGASCPDRTVSEVLHKIVALFDNALSYEQTFAPYLYP